MNPYITTLLNLVNENHVAVKLALMILMTVIPWAMTLWWRFVWPRPRRRAWVLLIVSIVNTILVWWVIYPAIR